MDGRSSLGVRRTPFTNVENIVSDRPSKSARSAYSTPAAVSFGPAAASGGLAGNESQSEAAAGRLTAEQVAMAHRILAAQAARRTHEQVSRN